MGYKKIIPITLLVCALSFILVFADNGFLQSAYALSLSHIIITSAGQSSTFYYSTAERYILNEGAGVIGNINPTTKAHSTVTLTSVAPESYSTGLYCSTGVGCYISETSGALPDNIYLFNPLTGSRLQTFTVSTSGADINIAGISTVSSNANLNKDGWFQASCSAGGSVIFNVQGVVLGDCAGTNFGANNVYAVEQIGTVVGITTASATNSFQIWSLSSLTRVCQVNVNVSGGGSVESYNSNFYVVVGTNTINKYDTSCNAGTGISGTGISSQMFGLQAISTEGVMAVEGTTSIAYMNLTSNNISTLSFTVVTNYTETSTTIRNLRFVYATGFNQSGVMLDVTGTSDPFLFVQYVPAGSEASSNTVNGVDCNDSANSYKLICRLASNSGALTAASESIEQSGNNIACQIRILSCTQDSDGNFTPDNPDMQTNGVGYIFTMVLLGVMVGLFWVASRGDLTSIPTFLWFIGTLAVLGASTTLQWIDPTFLVIGVIAIAGFAVAKARNVFGGGLLNESLS